jgi:hypothetical protein
LVLFIIKTRTKTTYEDPEILTHFCQVYGRSLDAVEVEWRRWLEL